MHKQSEYVGSKNVLPFLNLEIILKCVYLIQKNNQTRKYQEPSVVVRGCGPDPFISHRPT